MPLRHKKEILATKLITRKTTGLLVAVHLLFEIRIVGFFSLLSALCIFFSATPVLLSSKKKDRQSKFQDDPENGSSC